MMVTVAYPDHDLETDELVDFLKSRGVPAGFDVTEGRLEVVVPAAQYAESVRALKEYRTLMSVT